MAFPSFLLHEVTPVTKGTTKSLVCWTLGCWLVSCLIELSLLVCGVSDPAIPGTVAEWPAGQLYIYIYIPVLVRTGKCGIYGVPVFVYGSVPLFSLLSLLSALSLCSLLSLLCLLSPLYLFNLFSLSFLSLFFLLCH